MKVVAASDLINTSQFQAEDRAIRPQEIDLCKFSGSILWEESRQYPSSVFPKLVFVKTKDNKLLWIQNNIFLQLILLKI